MLHFAEQLNYYCVFSTRNIFSLTDNFVTRMLHKKCANNTSSYLHKPSQFRNNHANNGRVDILYLHLRRTYFVSVKKNGYRKCKLKIPNLFVQNFLLKQGTSEVVISEHVVEKLAEENCGKEIAIIENLSHY